MLISSEFVVLAHLKLLSGLILDAFSIASGTQDRQMWTQSGGILRREWSLTPPYYFSKLQNQVNKHLPLMLKVEGL